MIQKRWAFSLARRDMGTDYTAVEVAVEGDMVDGVFVPDVEKTETFATIREMKDAQIAEARKSLSALTARVVRGDPRDDPDTMIRELDRLNAKLTALQNVSEGEEYVWHTRE